MGGCAAAMDKDSRTRTHTLAQCPEVRRGASIGERYSRVGIRASPPRHSTAAQPPSRQAAAD